MPKSAARAFLAVAVLALIALSVSWLQADEGDTKTADDKAKVEKAKAPKAEIDKKVTDFTVKDDKGRAFTLHASAISRKQAEKAVMDAAKAFGASKDANAKTTLDSLPGVKDEDGDLDDSLKVDLMCAAGSYFGLVVTDETIENLKTLGDLTEWIAGATNTPMLFVVWSPNCPSVKRQNDKLIDLAAKTRVRIFVLAANANDTDEHYVEFRDNFDFKVRIFPDREQKVTDILGGTATPHHFVVDKDAVLRYRGAIDNDPMGYMDDDERVDLLHDAIEAIKAGKDVVEKESEPAG